MVKILIIGQFFVSQVDGRIIFHGGTERYVYGLAKQLQSDGYEVIVLSTTTNKYEVGWRVLDGIKVFKFKSPEKLYGYFIDFLSFIYTIKLINSFNPDIIHVISVRYRFAVGAIAASKLIKKKVVCTITLTLNKKLRFALLLDYVFYGKIIGWSDAIISLSREMKNEISPFLNLKKQKRVVIIPSFFMGTYFNKMNKNIHSILYVGRLEIKQKGVDLLIKALFYVKKEIPDVRLHIVGEGSSMNYLKDLVIKCNLKENVIFYGNIDEKQLIDMYSSSEIFILPSHREGMPMVLLEAMSAGLPVIAFNIDCLNEALDNGKYGILVKRRDVDDLAIQIIKLLKDEKLKDDYSKKSFERSNKYSLIEVIRKIENIYSELN